MQAKASSQPLPVFVFLAVLFGVITTLFRYDGYGISDQIEQLPIILRQFDATYLQNDFFVNASAEFGPRWYFSQWMAGLAGTPERLPALFLGLTFLANISISVTSFFFAKKLYHHSNLAGLLAAALVMSVPTFGLGYTSNLYQTLFIESTLSIPFVFLAILFASHENLLVGTILAGIAALFHPLFGLEGGALLIASHALTAFAHHRKLSKATWQSILLSTGILGMFALLWIIPTLSQTRIASEKFIEIVAFFRHPHHYLPSTFPLTDYGMALGFLLAFAVAWVWRRTSPEKPSPAVDFLLAFSSLILVGFLMGYVFVEIIPVRLIVTAQTSRLLFLLKWVGLLMIGGSIAQVLTPEQEGTASLFLISVLSPITTGVAFGSQFIRPWINQHLPAIRLFFEPVFLLLAILTFLLQFGFRNYLFVILFILIGLFISFDRKILYAGVFTGTLLLTFVTLFRQTLPLPDFVQTAYEDFDTKLQITYSDIGGQGRAVADFARNNTPPDSIFLTPPAFGQFRLFANRAIVLDFKAFPFQETAMEAWYTRLTTVYGLPKQTGFAMLSPLEKNYSHLTDEKLIHLQQEYHFSYAVLFLETDTRFPVLFENNEYKLVQLDQQTLK